MHGDARSRQVAVVADRLLNAPGGGEPALDVLVDEGWGVIQLPPTGLDRPSAAAWLEQVAEQVAEFRRNGYAVVLVDDGGYGEPLAHALAVLDVEALPAFGGGGRDELLAFLRAYAYGGASATP